MAKRALCLWVAVILLVSCQKAGEKGFGEGRQTFRELLTLRDQIQKEFHETVGDVSLADGRMTVKLINSPLGARTREEKQQHADAVANFVVKNYKQQLTAVSIQFVSNNAAETYVGRVSTSS